MKKLLFLTFSAALFFSCSEEKEQKEYHISGILKNISDSTMVRLSAGNTDIDSALVLGEKFEMRGKVDGPTNVYLMARETMDYTSFWLENRKVTFEAEKGKFKEAKISGLEVQKEADILAEKVKPLRKQIDSLGELLSQEGMEKSAREELFAVYKTARENEMQVTRNFVRQHPQSVVSAHILSIYKTTWGKDTTSKLFEPMNEELRSTENGKSIARFIELSKNPQPGEKFVDFEMQNVKGENVRLSNVQGKYVLLEFWASWCGPCRVANPQLVADYKKYNPKGFEILGVSLDTDKGAWKKAIEKDGLVWEQVSDLKGSENEAALIYGVNGIPDNLLLDENGIIIARTLRGEALHEKLQELFDEKRLAVSE